MKIGMTGIFVNDVMQAHKFYTEILGFKTMLLLPEHLLAVVVSAEQADGASLMLEPDTNRIGKNYQEGLYQAGIPAIVMMSTDIHAEYEQLKAKGVVFKGTPEKTEWGTKTIFDDTCGNLIQLHQAM